MTELSFAIGDDTWKKLRERALKDLFWFCTAVLGYGDKFALEEETHRLPLLFAERRTGVPDIDNAPYQLIMLPRDIGKSSCITIGRTIQLACGDPNSATLIANEKQETAQDFIASIKHHFETNAMLRALFPEALPENFNDVTWSATRATLKRTTGRPESTFDCIGVGGTVIGKHFSHIVCDDLISREAMENARSGNWTIMQKVARWVNQLPPLLSHSTKPFPTLTFVGTRWWHDDVYDHIRKAFGQGDEKRYRIKMRLSDGRVISREVLRQGDLAILVASVVENGIYSFPKIWPKAAVDATLERDPEFAACNLFNEPSNARVRTFRDEWLRYWRYSDDEKTIAFDDHTGAKKFVSASSLHKVIAVDPAAISEDSSSGCRNAIVTLGTDQEHGRHFVLETHADRSDPKDLITDIVDAAQRWGVHQVYVELAGQQVFVIQWVEKEARERGYALNVEPLKPGGRNKDLRIGGLAVPFKNGDIYVHNSQSELIVDEYRHYRPGAKRRDVLDALAYSLEVAPKPIRNAGASARERSRKQLESYHRRIGAHN